MSKNRPSATKNTKFVSSDYNINLADDIINVDTTGGAVNLYLPNIKSSGLNLSPKDFCINDTGGVAGTNPINIFGVAGDLVNGGASTVINKDLGSGVAGACNINEWLISLDTDSSSSGIGGAGTTNFLAKFTSPSSIGNSLIHDNGTTVAIGIIGGDASALFQLDSTTQGFLPPRMDAAARDAITPVAGLTLYNSDSKQLEFWNGTAWVGHGAETLEQTLVSGNTSGANNIIMTNGQGIAGGTVDTGFLDLHNGADFEVTLFNDGQNNWAKEGLYLSDAYLSLFAGGWTAAFQAGDEWIQQYAGDVTLNMRGDISSSFVSDRGMSIVSHKLNSYTSGANSGESGASYSIIVNSASSTLQTNIGAGIAAKNNVIVGGESHTLITGVDNSVVLGGSGTNIGQSNTAYLTQIGHYNQNVGGFDTIINFTGATTGIKTQTFQDASGTIALTSDITPTLYNGNSTVLTGRVATLTDTLTFSGGTTIHTLTSGANTTTAGTGTNPIGFGSFGTLNLLTTGSAFDEFDGNFMIGAAPAWQAQLYDNTTFVENACAFVGSATFDVLRPYVTLYYTAPDGTTFKGFEANTHGERILSQAGGLSDIAMNTTDRLAYLNGSGGTGYMAVATWASVQANLGLDITDDVIPRGTGTAVEDGTWQNVGNDIYPTTTGSNIGDATHRVGTIFMSSVIDYQNGLTISSSQAGDQVVHIQTEQGANGKLLHIAPTGYTPTGTDFQYNAADAGGARFLGFNGSDGSFTLRLFNSGNTVESANFQNNGDVVLSPEVGVTSRSRVSIGTQGHVSNARVTLRGADNGVGAVALWAGGSTGTVGGIQVQNDGRVGFGFMGDTSTKVNARGIGATSATFGLKIAKSNGVNNLVVRDDGLTLLNAASGNDSGGGFATILAGTTTTAATGLEVGVGMLLRHDPTVDGSGRPTMAYFRGFKQGAFDSIGLGGVVGEAYNSGTGDFTNASLGVVGVLGQGRNTANDTTIQNMIGLDGNVQTAAAQGNEATIVHLASVRMRMDAITHTNVTNAYYLKGNAPSNLTGANVTNFYGLFLPSTTLTPTNYYGVYQQEADARNWFNGSVSIGGFLSVASTKFQVRGGGATSATNTARFENSAGTDSFVINDAGQIATGAGTSALVNSLFGAIHRQTGYNFGTGFYPNNATSAGVTIQMLGTTDVGLSIATQGAKTGQVVGMSSTIISTGNTIGIGVLGNARNGSAHNIGVDGTNGGGAGTTPSIYQAGVRGSSASNINAESYGGYFTALWNNALQAYSEDYIGVYGIATGTSGDGATSTGDLIGGKFAAAGVTGSGDRIALLVPSTGNIGTVVFGADSPSVNASLLEVTGDIEILGSNSVIWTDRTNGNRYEVYMDNGSLVSAVIP
jgi:hypothetical protein